MTQSQHIRIRGGKPLRGELALPPDVEVAQCVLAMAALSSGTAELVGAPEALNLASAIAAWRALGVTCTRTADAIVVHGAGLDGLRLPTAALDAGRSATVLALLAGVLSGQSFGTRIAVHPVLAMRSAETMVGMLRARGAQIAGTARRDLLCAPIAVAPLVGSERLSGLDVTLPNADRDAKRAALISGLYATSATTVSEPSVSPDHLERLMVALELPLRRVGSVVAFDPGAWSSRTIPALGRITLPGSTTLAVCLAVTAQFLPGSDFMLHAVGVNPTRVGALDMLAQWGRALEVTPTGEAALREPIADLRVRHAALRGGAIGGELLGRAPTELPLLAALGSIANRGVQLYDLAALAGQTPSGLAELRRVLSAFGIAVEQRADELRVARTGGLHATHIDVCEDPGLSLCACVLGLACPGETVVQHAAQPLLAEFPGLIEGARALGADLELS